MFTPRQPIDENNNDRQGHPAQQNEYRTINGRIDLLIGTKEYLYIIELKSGGTAKQSMEQIKDKEHSLPFKQQDRTIIKIGVNVSRDTRNI